MVFSFKKECTMTFALFGGVIKHYMSIASRCYGTDHRARMIFVHHIDDIPRKPLY